jgi:hypothetical protein
VTVTDGELEFAVRKQAAPYVTVSSAVLAIDDGTTEGVFRPSTENTTPQVKTSLRVNCGGTAFKDAKGNVWSADSGWVVDSGDLVNYGTTAVIGNTTPDLYPLYRTHRYNRRTGSFHYSFDGFVPGNYAVRLMWAEVDPTTNGNTFHVALNGRRYLQDFNPTKAAGGVQIAIDRTFPIVVTDGVIRIDFTASALTGYVGATINGIEIVPYDGTVVEPEPLPPPAVPPFAIRINCGGGAFTDAKGNTWAADSGWTATSGDITNFGRNYPVANATPDMYPLYQTHRYNHKSGSFYYSFTGIPAGSYTVRLMWAEVDPVTYGNKLHVMIGGNPVLTDFNPTQAAGGVQRAIDRTFTATVTDGTIRIDFTAAAGAGYVGATINGIEIVPAQGPQN